MADRLRHVLRALSAPWAITPEAFETVCEIIDRRAAGVRLSSEDVRAIVDESRAEFEARHAQAGPMAAGNGRTIAVIPIYGTILPRPVLDISGGGGCSMTELMDKVRAADADPTVGHILLDVDSPGGSAFLLPEAAAVIRNCATPITAIANPMCCSAAYYLASQANDLAATPSAIVGSIGTYARHVDYSGQLAQEGIKVTLVSAGDNKTNGNEFEPLSEDARAEIQEMVDNFYEQFVADVARGRGISPEDVLTHFGQGKSFSAVAAAGLGMVDRVATFDEVVAQLLGNSTSGYSGGSRAKAGLLTRDKFATDDAYIAAVQTYYAAQAALDDATIDALSEDSPAPTAEGHDDAETVVTFATDAEKLLARGFRLRETNSTGR